MDPVITEALPQFGEIKTAQDLGKLIRRFRKSQGLTLEKVAGLTNVGTRFLSELERGKDELALNTSKPNIGSYLF